MRHKSIVAWAVIMLGLSLASCSKDEPTKGNQPTPDTEQQGNANEPTEVVSVDFEMTEEEANSARSLNYTLTDGYSPNNMKLSDNQQEEMPALLILRSEEVPNAPIYKEIKWKRQTQGGQTVWTYRGEIGLLAGRSRDKWYAMVVVGGEAKEGTEKLVVKSHVSKVVDLSQGNEVSLDVPYVSSWRHMKWNTRTNSFQTIGNNKMRLYPLGIVMTYRLTNNMNLPSGVDGIRVMTNHLEGTGYYNLNASGLPALPTSTSVQTPEPIPTLKWTADEQNKANDASGQVLYGNDGSAGFRRYDYALSTDMVAKNSTSKKIVVAWYQPNNRPRGWTLQMLTARSEHMP